MSRRAAFHTMVALVLAGTTAPAFAAEPELVTVGGGTVGSIRVHWSIDRALEVADEATGTRVLRDLYAKMGPSAMDVDLDETWKRLGVRMNRGTVTFDDAAPLARIRRTITEPTG